jgi:predicted MPP superfamily phosphohydrolase
LGNGLWNLLNGHNNQFLYSRRSFISNAGLITAGLPFVAMLYGMVRTGYNLKVRKVKAFFPDLPQTLDGLKIVQISDLHSGSFSSNSFFEEAVERINKLEPDLIFFTGDLVNNEAVEAERFVSTFKKLNAKMGVFSVLGNHDYGDYVPWSSPDEKSENLKRLKQIHYDADWKLLLNDSVTIQSANEQIAVVGVENWGAARHFPKHGDLDKAVENVKEVPFKILLSHDPSHWDAQVLKHPEKFQLTLSGHTHGAQFGIEIPGFKWSPVQYIYKQWAGLYNGIDGQKLYVNRGLGFIGYMGRIGIPPEITLLELNSNKIS